MHIVYVSHTYRYYRSNEKHLSISLITQCHSHKVIYNIIIYYSIVLQFLQYMALTKLLFSERNKTKLRIINIHSSYIYIFFQKQYIVGNWTAK